MAVIGFTFVALGIWAATDPESFGKTIANFGEFNPHLIHDYAVCSITFGTGLLLGWRIPSWRAPTLILAAIWNGMHGFFHILDMSMANTKYLGPAEAILLCLTSGTLAGLAAWEYRHPRSGQTREVSRSGE
ncbi:hypothetical protein [Mycobacteroides stephanolepidis]|uniref:hypothetical protein n=1 Tax=[Mycobacterium] stephanolepidis TaxID=1520670 RepID=UPI000BBA641C|nr:hypothetical protein [[Mycobacterium] stephanolepidis]